MSNADPPEPPTYRAIKIEPGQLGSGTLARGINNLGEAAGIMRVSTQPNLDRAFVVLPVDNYGFGSAGVHLLAFAGQSGQNSRANDINFHGVVVGQSGVPGTSDREAYYWDLDAETDGFLGTLGGPRSEAARLNDQQPPQITGWAEETAFSHFAFRQTLGSAMIKLDPAVYDGSTGRDIASDGLIVGPSENFGFCFVGECLDTCNSATYWAAASTTGVLLDSLDDGCAGLPTYGRAVNDVHQIVGDGNDPTDENCGTGSGETCVPQPLFWETPASKPTRLPIPTDSQGLPVDGIRAVAINSPQPAEDLLVTGYVPFLATSDKFAVLWRRSGETWEWFDLNDLIVCGSPSHLQRALDVNDNGWIVATTELLDDAGGESYVLVPLDHCPGDIAGDQHFPDGSVGVPDLLYLLAAWCDTGPCDCVADLSRDGLVGVDDLLILLANWGTCPGYPEQNVPSLEEELNAVGLTMDDWDDFMEVMDSGTPAERENWLCWMERYLTQCQTCRPCPGSDPFAN